MISTMRVYDIIAPAIQRCGAFSYGEQIDPDLARTAISQLNIMRAAASQGYANYRYFDTTFTPLVAVKSVTLGPGGDFTERPAKIDSVTAIMGQVNRPLNLGTLEQYRSLTFVDVASVPSDAYLETGYPLTTLWLYPGLQLGYSLRVTGMAYQPDYENIDDTFADPPEYMDWFIKGVAAQIAPMLGGSAASHAGEAQLAKDALDRAGFATRCQTMTTGRRHPSFLAGM